MIFILLIQLSGCYSSKIISGSELPLPDSINYTYIVHSKKLDYLLENTTISNDTLLGKINSDLSSIIGVKIHVYPSSDLILKIDDENILKIPLYNTKKVKIRKFSVVKTILLVALGIPIIIISYALIDFVIYGPDIHIHFP